MHEWSHESCREMHRYFHGYHGFFRQVVLIKTNFFQFFSWKMVENWLSYAYFKFWLQQPKTDVTVVMGKHGRCHTDLL